MPRGDPAQARLRRGPQQPRRRRRLTGEDRQTPSPSIGRPAQARLRRGRTLRPWPDPDETPQGRLDQAIAEYREAIRLKPGLRHGPTINLGLALRDQGQARRGHRRIPRGDPAQARLRRGPLQPRRRPEGPGEDRPGHRRIPRGDPAQARQRRGPQQPRPRPGSAGEDRPGHRAIPRGDPAQARPRRGPHQPRRRPERSGEDRPGRRRTPRGDPAQARLRHRPPQPRHAALSDQEADQAIAEYRQAIRLNPDLADARYNLGSALRSQGKTDFQAVAEYRGRSGSSPTQQPGQRPTSPGEDRPGHRRIPRGDPAQARLR